MTFGQALAAYLSDQHRNATDCAVGSGVAVSTVTRTLNGECSPSLETRLAIQKWTRGKVRATTKVMA